MKKVRIVEREHPEGYTSYEIQQRHCIFKFWWIDAWLNNWDLERNSSFSTLEKAKEHLKYFQNGSGYERVHKDTVLNI